MTIKRIEIKEIDIPVIRIWEGEIPTLDLILKPIVDIPGCVDAHRNNLTELINEDGLGTYQACGTFNIPSYEPLEYNPSEFIYTTPNQPSQEQQQDIQTEQPKLPQNKKKEEEIVIPPCPGKKDLRVGSFVNEKRLERVKGYVRGEDGIECITLYEDVPFKDQYIPNLPTVISTALIASVAATTPLLLNVVKPLVKNVIKKLTKKKDKVK
tara:strand:+ start:128 stop:757 length:630 start_codon:yes stop_codon:yes gene_type:complete